MYEIGKIYVWQNQVDEMAFLNGTECIVLGPPEHEMCIRTGRTVVGQRTDSAGGTEDKPWVAFAEPGDLRPKRPPPGERGIMELFRVKEHA